MKKIELCCIFILCAIMARPLLSYSEEGVTDTEIRIAQFGPLTGTAAAWGNILKGSDILFQMVNDQGGIHGRKIKYFKIDDGYNPSRTMACVKEFQEKNKIFAWLGGIGTMTCLSVIDYLMNKNIPWLFPMSGSKLFSDPPRRYLFTLYPPYFLEAKILCHYAAEKINKKRISIVYQNDVYGKEALEGVILELNKYGLNLTAKIPVERDDMNLKRCVEELKQANTDAVLLYTTPFVGLRIMKAANALNLTPQWMGGCPFSDFPLMYKVSKGLLNNFIAVNVYDLSEITLLEKYKKAYRKYTEKNEEWSVFHHVGFGIAELTVEALKRCGSDLTRERFITELEGLKNFKGISLATKFEPFDSKNPLCRRNLSEVYLIQCLEGGKIKAISDRIKINNLEEKQ